MVDVLYRVHRSADRGDAPLVVVVHGAMDRSSSFGRVARHLEQFDLLRYDRRGYGRSAELAPHDTIAGQVDDLLAVLGDRSATVFGHSIGGVIAAAAAARAPEQIRSVLAYEPPAPWRDWWPSPPTSAAPSTPAIDPADEAEAFMRRAIGDRYWDRLPARTRSERRAEGAALQADLASLRGTAPFGIAEVTVPVLVAYGADTSWWHRRAAQELAADLAQGELVAVAGAGHGVHLTHPTATADLVRRSVAAGARPSDR
jgi:pimeloyl-ACP methyl ester carboxylesterase